MSSAFKNEKKIIELMEESDSIISSSEDVSVLKSIIKKWIETESMVFDSSKVDIAIKVKQKLNSENGKSVGSIQNSMRNISKKDIQYALDYLLLIGLAEVEKFKPKRGPETYHYILT